MYIILKSNGNISHSTTDLVKKAKKALFCIKYYTTSLNNFPVHQYLTASCHSNWKDYLDYVEAPL
jgi:hypothetical protein